MVHYFDLNKFNNERKTVQGENVTQENSSTTKTQSAGTTENFSEKVESTTKAASKNSSVVETPNIPTTQEIPILDTLKGIDSKMFLELGDVVVSRTMSIVSNLAGLGTSYKDFKLDADEKKSLAPFFDTVVKGWIQNLKPEHAFYIVLAMIYGSKVMTAVENAPSKKALRKEPKNENNNTGTGSGRGRPKGTTAQAMQERRVA